MGILVEHIVPILKEPDKNFTDQNIAKFSEIENGYVDVKIKVRIIAVVQDIADRFDVSENELTEILNAIETATRNRSPKSKDGKSGNPRDIYRQGKLDEHEIAMFENFRFDVFRKAFNLNGFFVREIIKTGSYDEKTKSIDLNWYIRVHNSGRNPQGHFKANNYTMTGGIIKVDNDIFMIAQYDHGDISRKRRFLITAESISDPHNDARWGVIFSDVPPAAVKKDWIGQPIWGKACLIRVNKADTLEISDKEKEEEVIITKDKTEIYESMDNPNFPFYKKLVENIFEQLEKYHQSHEGLLFFTGGEDDFIGIAEDEMRKPPASKSSHS